MRQPSDRTSRGISHLSLQRASADDPRASRRKRGVCSALFILVPLLLAPLGAAALPGPDSGINGPHVVPPATPAIVHPAELLGREEHPRPVKPFLFPWGQAELDRQKAEAELSRVLSSGQLMTLSATINATSGTGFNGINSTESSCNCYPPDGAIAASQSYVVAAVNTAYKVFDKNGNLQWGPTSLNALFSTNNSCLPYVSDPFAAYDAATGEFVLGALTYDSSYSSSICVAVTTTPTGGWTVYGFPVTPQNNLLDFPRMAIGTDAIYVSGNQFQNGVSFIGARVYAYNKGQMYAGQTATAVYYNVGSNAAGHLADSLTPAQGVSAPSTAYFIAADNCNGCSVITAWKWTSPFGTSAFTQQGGWQVTAYNQPPNARQPGGGRITTNDTRNLGAFWYSGTLYGTHTTGCNPGTGTVACVQWYQFGNIDTISTTLRPPLQQGTATGPKQYRYYPNLAADSKGNLGLAYAYSSTTDYAGIRYTGRLAGDTLGTLEAEAVLVPGQAPINGTRYGDYAGTVLDPNACTIWHLEEYAEAGYLWGTWVGSFGFNGC